MLKLYRKTYIKLAKLVFELEKSGNRAVLCLEIQKILIVKIRYVEKKIRYWKKKSKQTQAEADQQKVKDYQRIRSTLKCFGDAIVFSHMDRWDVKALSLNHTSGFISDKEGFNLESRILTEACNRGLPSVLTDLTNCLRFGDLFGFMPDRAPLILEIKDSKSQKSGRNSRQKKKLNEVVSYLRTDERSFRGGLMKRVELPSEPQCNSELVSTLASIAFEKGDAFEILDTGVAYVVANTFDEEIFDSISSSFEKPTIYFVKSGEYFSFDYPYYPITLMLKDPEALAEYLCAGLFIFVIVDLAVLEEAVRQEGATIEFLESDESWAVNIIHSELGPMKISHTMFARLFYEFLDPMWFGSALTHVPIEVVADYLNQEHNK